MKAARSLHPEQLCEEARILREGGLLRDENERNAVRIVEIACAQERASHAGGDREQVFNIWKELLQVYPNDWEIKEKCQEAYIEWVLAETDRLATESLEGAIQYLLDKRKDGEFAKALDSWKVLLKLAELHAQRESFDQARRYLEQAERQDSRWDEDFQKTINNARSYITSKELAAQVMRRVHNAPTQAEQLRYLKEGLDNSELRHPDVRRELEQRRSEIFLSASEEARDNARHALGQGTHEGKLEALTWYIYLYEIEELADIPEDKRFAPGEIEKLRDELPSLARKIVHELEEFRVSDFRLQEALERTAQFRGYLDALIKAIDRFGDDILKSQLPPMRRWHTNIAELHGHLQRLSDLLQEALQPELWEDAIRTNNFRELDNLQRRMKSLPYMQEVGEFERRLAEWEEVNDYLEQGIIQLRQDFAEDRFEEVLEKLGKLKRRPSRRMDGTEWLSIDPKEYETIWAQKRVRARIWDICSEEVVGWDEIEQLARQRLEEREKWEQWLKELNELHHEAQAAYEEAHGFEERFEGDLPMVAGRLEYFTDNHPGTRTYLDKLKKIVEEDLQDFDLEAELWGEDFQPDEKLSYQKRHEVWDKAQKAMQALLTHISSGGPREGDVVLPVCCKAASEAQRKAEEYRNRYAPAIDYAGKSVERSSRAIELFPKPQEFETARSVPILLKAVITKAEIIGAPDEDNRNILVAWKRTLEKLEENLQKKQSFFGKLANFFRGGGN